MKISTLLPIQTPFPLLILGGLLAILSSCQPTSASPAPAGAVPAPGNGTQGRRSAVVTVQVQTLKYGPLVVQNATGGTVAAETQSSVAAGTSGTVKTLVRKAGDWVQEGAPVIRLDDSQLQLSLKLAQANLNTAKLNAGLNANGTVASDSKAILQLQSAQKSYESALALSKIGGIAGSDLDTAQANYEAAKMAVQQNGIGVDTATLQVQQAQLNLEFATIKAPYAGQVVAINVHPGEYVTASTPAFILVSQAKVVNFNVPPSDAVGLNHGAKITFTQDGKTYPVTMVGVPSAPVNGQVPLTASLPAGFPGSYGTVGSVAYSQVLATGVLLPLPAIQSLENTTYAFVVKNNKATRSDITILADSGSYSAVSGLQDGDTVILNPPPGLLVGATVQPLQTTAPAATNGKKPAAPAGGGN